MSVTYEIYRRYSERDREYTATPIEDDIYYGKRYELIQDFTTLSMTLNWLKRSKFTFKGNALKESPLIIGDSILVYRNAELLFTGTVDTVNVKCKDVYSNIVEWEASGQDEGVIFGWRYILTDFENTETVHISFDDGQTYVDCPVKFKDLTFDNEHYVKCSGYAYDRQIYYMKQCFDPDIVTEGREIKDIIFPPYSGDAGIPVSELGEEKFSSFQIKKLSSALSDIGKDTDLFPQYQWNPITGEKTISIPMRRDLSGMDEEKEYDPDSLITISPEYGNVEKWSVKRTFPKYNAVWVCSGEHTSEETGYEELTPKFTLEKDANGKLTNIQLGFLDIPVTDGQISGLPTINEERKRKIEQEQIKKAQLDEKTKLKKRVVMQYAIKKHFGYELTDEQIIDLINQGILNYDMVELVADKYKTRLWVYAEDKESISKYGRIEHVITKSEYKIGNDLKDTEEEEKLSEDEVFELLEKEAEDALKDGAEKEKYTITFIQNEDLVFMKDWKLGDKVKVVLNGKTFSSTIDTVSISFTGNVEKVTPTLGGSEEGIYSDVFEMIRGIDKRLESTERA